MLKIMGEKLLREPEMFTLRKRRALGCRGGEEVEVRKTANTEAGFRYLKDCERVV